MSRWLVAGIAALAAAACAKTTRIDTQEFSTRRLKAESHGVALMRVGAASHKCLHVAVLLGVAEGGAYRRVAVLGVANVRSLSQAPVAEVELPAGEYHVVGYSCTNEKGSKVVADDTGPYSQWFTSSFARFLLGAGEVVNVGYLHFKAEGNGDSIFGRAVKTEVAVTDWPLDEIRRFEMARPELFAVMTTRLMTAGAVPPVEATAGGCDALRALQAAGKVADLPKPCGRVAAAGNR